MRCYRLAMPKAPPPPGSPFARPSAGPGRAGRSARSPLEGTSTLIVDGTNLLYRLGSPGAAPPAAIIGRLRAAIPAPVDIELVFDGMGHGVFGRVAQGMHVRYAGRRTADEVILELAGAAAIDARRRPVGGAGVLAVTNDRELRGLLQAAGARTASLQWLLGRLDLPVLASPATGNRRPPAASRDAGGAGPGTSDDDDRPRWKPGRGATAKKGPARRVARHKRHPRQPG